MLEEWKEPIDEKQFINDVPVAATSLGDMNGVDARDVFQNPFSKKTQGALDEYTEPYTIIYSCMLWTLKIRILKKFTFQSVIVHLFNGLSVMKICISNSHYSGWRGIS